MRILDTKDRAHYKQKPLRVNMFVKKKRKFPRGFLLTLAHPENEASIRTQTTLGFKYIKTGNLEPPTNLHENIRNVYQLDYSDFIS